MPKTIDLDALRFVSRKRRTLSSAEKKKRIEQKRKDATKRRKELRESRLSRGFCGRCGIDPVEKWRRFCAVCLENAARMNRESWAKRQKKRRQDAKKTDRKSETRSGSGSPKRGSKESR